MDDLVLLLDIDVLEQNLARCFVLRTVFDLLLASNVGCLV